MVFKTLDPDVIMKALEGHGNVLKDEVEKQEEFFRDLTCVKCGSSVTPFLDSTALFKDGQNLPNYLVRCESCGCEFEPYSKVEIDSSDPF